jgi:hypothetical protein
MYKKFSQLSFVIGLFFSIVSLILVINAWLSEVSSGISLYTGIGFLIFGLGMMFLKSEEKGE